MKKERKEILKNLSIRDIGILMACAQPYSHSKEVMYGLIYCCYLDSRQVEVIALSNSPEKLGKLSNKIWKKYYDEIIDIGEGISLYVTPFPMFEESLIIDDTEDYEDVVEERFKNELRNYSFRLEGTSMYGKTYEEYNKKRIISEQTKERMEKIESLEKELKDVWSELPVDVQNHGLENIREDFEFMLNRYDIKEDFEGNSFVQFQSLNACISDKGKILISLYQDRRGWINQWERQVGIEKMISLTLESTSMSDYYINEEDYFKFKVGNIVDFIDNYIKGLENLIQGFKYIIESLSQ